MSIEIRNVSFSYMENGRHEIKALKNISVHIGDGEFAGIMGQTGCGKSTLIQSIAGLLKPASGQIFIDGEDINREDYDRGVLRKKVGIVFQYPEYQLFESTVEKDVAFALKNSGMSKSEIEARVRWALEVMGFAYDDIRKQSSLSLSGGEKRKVAIAGVLAAKPKILIFDEPIAGLDPYGRNEFLELVSKLNRKGVTILMVSHNTDCLCEYAQRILVLKSGMVVLDGEPEQVFSSANCAKTPYIANGNIREIAQKLYEKGMIGTPDIVKFQKLTDEIKKSLKVGERL